MKTSVFASICAFVFCFQISAQNVWLGGKTGVENDWNVPQNWSKNRIPNEFDHVIIPNVTSQSRPFPIIDEKVNPIAALQIESGATLHISENGHLTVDGSTTFNYGILNIGTVKNEGLCVVKSTGLQPILNKNGTWQNDGKFAAIEVLNTNHSQSLITDNN
jgi:hypothetical protein